MKNISRIILLSFAVFCGTWAQSAVRADNNLLTTAQHTKKENILIQVGHFTDNLHSTFMAFKLANGLLRAGDKVVLFLNLEAVRIADKDQPLDLTWGKNPSLKKLYEKFIEDGGTIIVCEECLKVSEVTARKMREGVMAVSIDQTVEFIKQADKVLTY